jgi:large subunit ribosomal protein L35
MPKMKTNRGAAKRFKVSGSGKLMRHKAFSSHILKKGSAAGYRGRRHQCKGRPADDSLHVDTGDSNIGATAGEKIN